MKETKARRKRVTARWLEEACACTRQLRIFAAEWPHGCVVNRKNVERAVALKIDMEWFGDQWLSGAANVAFRKASWKAAGVWYDTDTDTPGQVAAANHALQVANGEALIKQVEA